MDEAFRAFMYSALMPFCFLYLSLLWVQPSLRAADESRANALWRPWPLWVCASISARIIASRKILRSLETNGPLRVRSPWCIVILVLVAFHHLREWNISLFKGSRLGILLFFHCALFLCSLSLGQVFTSLSCLVWVSEKDTGEAFIWGNRAGTLRKQSCHLLTLGEMREGKELHNEELHNLSLLILY